METILEVCFLTAAVYPWLRLTVNRGFWRKLRVFPGYPTAFIALLTLYLGLIAGLALWYPAALRWVSALAAGILIYTWWRARADYGRSRGWPPGSLALAPLAPWTDDLYYLKQAARHGPVFKSSTLIRPVVCVVGFKPARELLRAHDSSLDIPPLPFTRFIPGGFLRYMSLADHRTYSGIFRSSIAAEVVEACGPYMARTIRDGLLRMAERSAAGPATDVPPEPHLDGMLFAIQTRLFFGILPESAAFARLEELYRVMDYRRAWCTSDSSVTRALDEATAILNQQMTRGEEPARCFLREMIQAHPETAHQRTALWNLIYILQTSWRDLAGLLQWNLKMLSDHPVWVGRLREEAVPDTLAGRVVMETLRMEQSDYLMRRATQDIRFNGFVIPKGWQVRICVRESHRSGEAFEHPERFDPDRFLAGDSSRLSYSPFGASRIHCPGEHLALTVGRIFVSELALGFDWQVTRDGPPEYGGFHWKPSSKFRLRIAPRKPAPSRLAT